MTVSSDPTNSPLLMTRSHEYMSTSHALGDLLALANYVGPDGDTSESGRLRNIARRLLSVLHYRDPATVEHSRRVAMIAVGVSESLGWNARQRSILEVAALVHDIGKIGVPDHILVKPAKLSSAEYELIVKYHRVAVSIFQACRADREFVQILSQMYLQYCDQEEQANGEIHLGARILAVSDAYDSLSTTKTFRRGHSHDEIMALLNEQAGTRFDGNIVRALSRWYDREGNSLLSLEDNVVSPQRPVLTPEQNAEIHLFGCLFGCLSLLETTYDGFCIVDRHQNIVVWSSGVERMLMRPTDQLLGQRFCKQVVPFKAVDDSDSESANMASTASAVLADGQIRLERRMMQKSDESWIELEVQIVPVLDQHGICGVAEIYHDKAGTGGTQSHAYQELKIQATRDALTGVANRGRLESQLEKMLEELRQTGGSFPVSIIFLDVDHFKSVNDNYGHAVGDRVLIELAKLLQHETYSGEIVGRYGGEEFVLLCPDTGIDDAVRRAERLRQAIAASEVGGMEDRKITSSFGVGEVQLTDTVQTAFERADACLYEAKHTGRNRVCWPGYDDEEEEKPDDEEENHGTFEKTEDGFQFLHTVIGNFSPEILRIKLGTFADENYGIMLDYDGKSARIQFGQKGLLPFWGAEEDRKPVEVSLVFREVRSQEPDRKRPYRQVEVEITINSIGWVRKQSTFETRVRELMTGLRWILSVE